MGRFKRNDLDRAIAAGRPRPSDELVGEISAQVSARPMPRRHSRTAFGLALATFMAGLFASFGGVGYAASGVSGTVSAVTTAVHVQSKASVRTHSSAKDEYGKSVAGGVIGKTKVIKKAKPKPTVAAVSPAQTVKTNQLPFTGLTLVPTIALALLLVAAGIMLRRRENRGIR
jgi:hypothetical protein